MSQPRAAPGDARRVLQRQAAGGVTAQNDPCAGWERDPESFSIHVARHYVRTQVNPAWSRKPVSVTCVSDHDCNVSFGPDLIIDVYWVRSTRRVGAGRMTDRGRHFCAYSYRCDPEGTLSLSPVTCIGPPGNAAP